VGLVSGRRFGRLHHVGDRRHAAAPALSSSGEAIGPVERGISKVRTRDTEGDAARPHWRNRHEPGGDGSRDLFCPAKDRFSLAMALTAFWGHRAFKTGSKARH